PPPFAYTTRFRPQARIALDLTIELANTATPPTFVPPFSGLATFADAVVLNEIVNAGMADIGLFGPADQLLLQEAQTDLNAIVADGEGLFDAADVPTVLLAALDVLSVLENLDCEGFF